ncbi:MAG: MerR family transcriptional regulator [Candidatus Dojkabacteria bacterium]
MTGVTDERKWRTTSEVVNITGIPESTIRRIIEKFRQFLDVKKRKGKRYFSNKAVEVLQDIRDRKQSGMSYNGILKLYEEQEEAGVIDIEPTFQRTGERQITGERLREERLLSILEGLQNALSTITEQNKKIDELTDEVDELKDQLKEERLQREKDKEEMNREVVKLFQEITEMFYNKK